MKKSSVKKTARRSTGSKRAKKTNSVEAGYNLVDIIVKHWNTQPNPPKVYVGGYRVHHGSVGAVSTIIGVIGLVASALSEDKKTQTTIANISGAIIGAGVRLMEDDIADVNDWFNFERQPQFQTANVQPLQFHPTTVFPIGKPTEFIQP